MKQVFIVGIRGNMANRYKAILRFLDIGFIGVDVNESISEDLIKSSDGILIATPTETHLDLICKLKDYQKPILCEKPLARSVKEIEKLKGMLSGINLQMVDQYRYMRGHSLASGDSMTQYNYYNSGKDGLPWDCINIVGKANGQISLRGDSPIWTCKINGEVLSIRDMDFAYCSMIKDWTKSPKSNFHYALSAHEAVEKYICKS